MVAFWTKKSNGIQRRSLEEQSTNVGCFEKRKRNKRCEKRVRKIMTKTKGQCEREWEVRRVMNKRKVEGQQKNQVEETRRKEGKRVDDQAAEAIVLSQGHSNSVVRGVIGSQDFGDEISKRSDEDEGRC
jgi:hypothetical protein